MDAPYISLVVAARNDNHGLNMIGRMQAFLDSWIEQAKRYRLPSEIVVVEWNPPEDRPALQTELLWPGESGPCAVRFIQVSREVHQSIPNAGAIPLHQMIAKNAGIRRAQGKFVLATNLDIIFSSRLMQFLAERILDPRSFYRTDRIDIDNKIPARGDLEELLSYCDNHILRICAREGVWATDGCRLRPVEPYDILSPDSGMRLGAGWFGLDRSDGRPYRYVEPVAEIVLERPASAGHQLILDVEAGPCAKENWVELVLSDSDGSEIATAIVDGRCEFRVAVPEPRSGVIRFSTRHGGIPMMQDPRLLDLRVFGVHWSDATLEQAEPPRSSAPRMERVSRKPGVDWNACGFAQSPHADSMHNPAYLHTNACGDFTLLSRDAWFALRGYPEFPVWPTHLDAILCYAAYHAGFPEIILKDPLRIFHIQHEEVWTPESEQERQRRAAQRGVSTLSYAAVQKYFHLMRRFNAPLIFAGENWGLGDRDLPETAVW
jgi:hypothetical protein